MPLHDKRSININYKPIRELYTEVSSKIQDLNVHFSGADHGLPYTEIDRDNLFIGLDLFLKGLIVSCTGLIVEDEHLVALRKQWNSEVPDDPVEFVFDICWK